MLRTRWSRIAVFASFTPILSAAYSNLIATADGSTVYFQVETGFVSRSWYVARNAGSVPVVEEVKDSVADVSNSGAVLASASYASRVCGFAGSTCFLAPSCSAGFTIRGPGIDVTNSRWRTLIRLDREGGLAWINQDSVCSMMGSAPPAALNGLYQSSSLRQVAPASGTKLANERVGRRAITDRRRALVFAGPQLSWLDSTGVRPIRHVAGAYEAVADAAGANVVYVESEVGGLHWIAADDEKLGLTGSAPALSDDGRILAFLGEDESLQIYDRGTRTARRLGPDTYSSFTLGGGQTVFATTAGNKLVRVDIASGAQSVLLEPFPEIQSTDTPQVASVIACPLVCYAPESWLGVGRGMVVVLRGRFLDQRELRVRSGGWDTPLNALSATAAWFQVPSDSALTSDRSTLEIYNLDHPVKARARLYVQERVVTCFGTLHQDYRRFVASDNRATSGEIVHVFMTGLRGIEPVPDGAPNPFDHLVLIADPPAFADPGASERLFFGLAPGLIGIQQLDLRVVRPSQDPSLFKDVTSFNCTSPL
jgi:uncharacterized protein (TIGR03437 family)